MIKKIDRDACCLIERAIQENLADWAARQGLVLQNKGGNYTDQSAVLKIEFAVKNSDGEAETRETVDFKLRARQFGMLPSDLGRSFVSPGDGTRYTIVGLNPRAYAYPIIAVKENGERRKFSAGVVRTLLANERVSQSMS